VAASIVKQRAVNQQDVKHPIVLVGVNIGNHACYGQVFLIWFMGKPFFFDGVLGWIVLGAGLLRGNCGAVILVNSYHSQQSGWLRRFYGGKMG